jgi:tRNA 5-methylaminomethyl-2-thiouridine biosynthesis bifunctional protein
MPPAPALDWTQEGVPVSRAFQDVYYSRAGGLAETEAVFLHGCGLPEGWARQRCFSIGELGFGAGLNALATWRLWRKHRPPGATLHFTSLESHPLDARDAARAHAHFPEIQTLSALLLKRWPVRTYGPQRLWFEADGFCLTVWIGTAQTVLPHIHGRFDAWFLDGFSPSKNPEMWGPDVWAEVARLSAPGARLATYSVAGAVRRGLEQAGFAVTREAGFGAKRERLEACFQASPPASGDLFGPAPMQRGDIAIVGGGIAGASVALALRRRGLSPSLFQAEPGASANPRALVFPRLDRTDAPISVFYRAAYLYALDAYTGAGLIESPGLVRFGAAQALLADPPLPETHLLAHGADAVLHPLAGAVDPIAVTEAFLAGAPRGPAGAIDAIERAPQGGWLLIRDGRAVFETPNLVLATGAAIKSLAPWLPQQISRGQVDWAGLAGAAPPTPLSGEGYAMGWGERLLFGATFDPVTEVGDTSPTPDASARNRARLARLAPDFCTRLTAHELGARVSYRVAAPDRAPWVGPAPDLAVFAARWAGPLSRGMHVTDPAPHLAGLYVLGGFGARGFSTAPLAGEALAAEMLQEPWPLDAQGRAAIHPMRHIIRAARRRQTDTQ